MYFHTDNKKTLEFLSNVTARAAEENLSLRLDVDSKGRLKVKMGGGIWTAPFDSTFDLSRDTAG